MLLQVSVDLSLELFQRIIFGQLSQLSLVAGFRWADFTFLPAVRLHSEES